MFAFAEGLARKLMGFIFVGAGISLSVPIFFIPPRSHIRYMLLYNTHIKRKAFGLPWAFLQRSLEALNSHRNPFCERVNLQKCVLSLLVKWKYCTAKERERGERKKEGERQQYARERERERERERPSDLFEGREQCSLRSLSYKRLIEQRTTNWSSIVMRKV